MGPALGHVRGEGGRDPQPEQPAGQAGYRHPVPGRVQDDHRTGPDEAVDRGRLQPGGDPALAVGLDDGVGVAVGDIGCDGRHGEHGRRRGQADGPVDAARPSGMGAAGGHRGRGHCPASRQLTMSAGHEARASERVIVRHGVAVGAEQAAECGGPYLLDGGVYRTKIGPGETIAGYATEKYFAKTPMSQGEICVNTAPN